MRVPRKIPTDGTGTAGEGDLYTAEMSVYGSRDAPRGFYLALWEEMVRAGLREVHGEPALYVLEENGKILGMATTHVDDLLWCGGPEMDRVMEVVQRRFTFPVLREEHLRQGL